MEDLNKALGRMPQAWKVSLAVWAPIILIGLIYGVLYLSFNAQANHDLNKALQEQAACQKTAQEDNDKVRQDAINGLSGANNGVETCQNVNNVVGRSTLWLPKYSQ